MSFVLHVFFVTLGAGWIIGALLYFGLPRRPRRRDVATPAASTNVATPVRDDHWFPDAEWLS